MKHTSIILPLLFVVSCSSQQPGASTLAGDVNANNLWAGKVAASIERSSSDPCANGIDMNSGDLKFTGWARQRAVYTNICFEVWSSGVTDNDNGDFWTKLDVQVHYRYEGQGSFKTEYVSSVGRSGNNRRYAWNMRNADPFRSSSVSPGTPHRVLRRWTNTDGRTWASVESLMEVYFTVNGQILNKHDGWNFHVNYTDATIQIPN